MSNIKIQGYCILTECLGGPELVWRILNEDSDGDYPEIHDTEREAQMSIVCNQIEHLEEFLTNDREYEDIDWEHEYTVAKIIIYTDGEMMVYHGDDDAPQPVLITSLTAWREGL
jgi:hypothetical protein